MQITNIHECHSRLRLRLAEYFNYHIYLFRLFLHTNAQPFAAWIVDQMVSVSRENVDVIQAMLEIYVINCHAIPVALNMVNVKTERAFARKDGMDAIAHCVSISTSTSHPFIPFRFFVLFLPPKSLSVTKEQVRKCQTHNGKLYKWNVMNLVFTVVRCVKHIA